MPLAAKSSLICQSKSKHRLEKALSVDKSWKGSKDGIVNMNNKNLESEHSVVKSGHPLFELLSFLNGKSVSLCNDRDSVHYSPQPLHKFNVNGT